MTNHSFKARNRRLNGIPQCCCQDLKNIHINYTNQLTTTDESSLTEQTNGRYSVIDGFIRVAVLQVKGIDHHSLGQFETIADPVRSSKRTHYDTGCGR